MAYSTSLGLCYCISREREAGFGPFFLFCFSLQGFFFFQKGKVDLGTVIYFDMGKVIVKGGGKKQAWAKH